MGLLSQLLGFGQLLLIDQSEGIGFLGLRQNLCGWICQAISYHHGLQVERRHEGTLVLH